MSLVKSMFCSVETKAGHCDSGLGVGTPCVSSGDPQFSESSREYTERRASMSSKGAGPLQVQITVEWCGHKEDAHLKDLNVTNIFKMFDVDLYLQGR